MSKILKTLILTVIFLLATFSICSAKEVTNFNDFVEKAKALDGQQVTIKGEAIGESMKRGDHAWVNVSDGSTAIGVWIKASDLDRIKIYGGYKHIGDKVQVDGIFHRACSEHGGDLDIHADSIEVIKNGEAINHSISSGRIEAASILSFAAIVLFIVYFKRKGKLF